jgi:serine/threonine protein kinase
MKELLPAAGTVLSHYRILSRLGAGGMGEVYLAEDTRLDRKVALKILPDDSTADHRRMRRFVQEAKLASSLSHPNICVIHEVRPTKTVSHSSSWSTSMVKRSPKESRATRRARRRF